MNSQARSNVVKEQQIFWTNKQTWLMKQTGKIRGQIFHGGFSSETECSERKKKDEETNQLLEAWDVALLC